MENGVVVNNVCIFIPTKLRIDSIVDGINWSSQTSHRGRSCTFRRFCLSSMITLVHYAELKRMKYGQEKEKQFHILPLVGISKCATPDSTFGMA